MKTICAALAVLAGWTFIAADEPDGLKLPSGFHATVVAEGLGAIRHLAVRDNGDIYVSTPRDQKGLGKGGGIIALRLDAAHKAVDVQHFGSIDGGTGIRFHNGALYATSPSGIYRFAFTGNALIPAKDPDTIVDGMPTTFPGFNRANRPLAFDGNGHVFVSVEASGNFCADPETKPNTPPVGLKPCPDLGVRAGIWRFSADKIGQKFPSDGEQWATGIRDLSALAWSPSDGNLYAIMHGRDSLNRNWPTLVSAEDDNHIADEMHRVTKGTDFGWPYTYYDGVRKMRLVSPEYGARRSALLWRHVVPRKLPERRVHRAARYGEQERLRRRVRTLRKVRSGGRADGIRRRIRRVRSVHRDPAARPVSSDGRGRWTGRIALCCGFAGRPHLADRLRRSVDTRGVISRDPRTPVRRSSRSRESSRAAPSPIEYVCRRHGPSGRRWRATSSGAWVARSAAA
jgi:hypothetical protein